MEEELILEVQKINKSFGSTQALKNVNLKVYRHKILGLIGENGSGKSTVTSIIAGIQKADNGKMLYKGREWTPHNMIDALHSGIGIIVQESGTVPGISVAENIFLGEISQFIKHGIVDKKRMYKEAKMAFESLGINNIDVKQMTHMYDLQDRKLIEIVKVMIKNPDILIVDETTTALSQKGRDIIYKLMKKMRKENKAVIFISHDIEEIMSVCNVLTVLRDGNIIRSFDKSEFDESEIKRSMIGRELEGHFYRSDFDDYENDIVFELKNITADNQLKDLSLQLHKGEILGIGGLSDCGMHTLGKVGFAALPLQSGSLMIKGQKVKSIQQAIDLKVGYISKDRDNESLCLEGSIKDNIAIAGLNKIEKNHLISSKKERQYVQKQIDNLEIKCQGMEQSVSHLSGGNKQKVVFGKWIGRDSEILILDCPTRGVDIGVKQAMYQLMYEMKKQNKSIIIISEEMTELIGMADRILVMRNGNISGELYRKDNFNEEEIINYMI